MCTFRLVPSILTLAFVIFSLNTISAQPWFENDPNDRTDKHKTLTEYQELFNNYWAGKDIELGYYYENGEKKKAYGWKQFKRWENYWESRVNEDGSFPSQRQYDKALRSYQN